MLGSSFILFNGTMTPQDDSSQDNAAQLEREWFVDVKHPVTGQLWNLREPGAPRRPKDRPQQRAQESASPKGRDPAAPAQGGIRFSDGLPHGRQQRAVRLRLVALDGLDERVCHGARGDSPAERLRVQRGKDRSLSPNTKKG
jgi:hypothetical protein